MLIYMVFEDWCEKLTELCWTNRQQIKRLELQRTQLVRLHRKFDPHFDTSFSQSTEIITVMTNYRGLTSK